LLKEVVEGLTEICGCTPVPLSVMMVGEFVALLNTVRLPVALVAAVGVNPTMRERLWPGERVTVRLNPLTANPVPVLET